MAGLNKVCLIGNLGKDPEVRNLTNGGRVVSFSVAITENWRDKTSGERREETEWIPVVIFSEPLGKIAEQYLKKGSKAYIEGKMRTRKWQDQSGADRYSTEVVLENFGGTLVLLGDPAGGKREDDGGQPYSATKTHAATAAPSYAEELDDEIPF